MTGSQVYALLVGINEYPAPVPRLNACEADVGRMEIQLGHSLGKDKLKTRVLLGKDATRNAIIRGFREFLGQARAGEIAFFYFAGHGSQQRSAFEFSHRGLSSENIDETMVCYDSRVPGGHDLADKEIAVLIQELSEKGAKVRLVFDCCFAGGVVRSGKQSFQLLGHCARSWRSVLHPRPLASYLDGYYSRQDALGVPEPSYIALQACHRMEEALEIQTHGLYTHFLLKAFEELGLDPPMSQLHRITRYYLEHALETSQVSQTPQMTSYGGADLEETLFGENRSVSRGRRFGIRRDGNWFVEKGIFDGIRPGSRVFIFDRMDEKIGEGEVVGSGLLKSGFNLEKSVDLKYASISTLPSHGDKLKVHLSGVRSTVDQIRKYWRTEDHRWLEFVDSRDVDLQIEALDNEVVVLEGEGEHVLFRNSLGSAGDWKELFKLIYHALRWKVGLNLQDNGLCVEKIEFYFNSIENQAKIQGEYYQQKLEFKDQRIRLDILAHNQTDETLYFTLLYFTREKGIKAFPPIPAPAKGNPITLVGDAQGQDFYLPDCYTRNVDHLRLLVTRTMPDWYLLPQADLNDQIRYRHLFPDKKVDPFLITEWGMKDLKLELYRK